MNKKNTYLLAAAVLIIASIYYLEAGKPEQSNLEPVVAENVLDVAEKVEKYDKAKEITTPDGFINVDEISVGELIGEKVILVDFWTYSCINCQRTIPYLNAWYDKYADKGLEILAIHTPEFKFEEEYDNVLQAVEKFGIKYPVILDNDYSTWRAYENRYWPRKYLIDIDGFIIYDHIGEGAYEETEKEIQKALAERAQKLETGEVILGDSSSPDNAIDITKRSVGSPEIYFGASRNERLGNGIQGKTGEQVFVLPEEITENVLYLEGLWNIEKEYSEGFSGSSLIFNYKASDVHMVLAPADGKISKAYLKRDGQYLEKELAGKDVLFDGEKSYVEIKENTLYNLVSGDDPNSFHQFELILEDDSVYVFTFTFG